MEQPVPRVFHDDVERILARDFAEAARDLLRVRFADPEQAFSPRVLLAVLKLADGDVDRAVAHLEAARKDWRDVIAWAEYPSYTDATSGANPADAARRKELIQRDWEEYHAWLRR
jgi:hypothetical protein